MAHTMSQHRQPPLKQQPAPGPRGVRIQRDALPYAEGSLEFGRRPPLISIHTAHLVDEEHRCLQEPQGEQAALAVVASASPRYLLSPAISLQPLGRASKSKVVISACRAVGAHPQGRSDSSEGVFPPRSNSAEAHSEISWC
jgi:hypothetical protein